MQTCVLQCLQKHDSAQLMLQTVVQICFNPTCLRRFHNSGDIISNVQKYDELKRQYEELEKNGKMHKMNDLYNLCEEFDR